MKISLVCLLLLSMAFILTKQYIQKGLLTHKTLSYLQSAQEKVKQGCIQSFSLSESTAYQLLEMFWFFFPCWVPFVIFKHPNLLSYRYIDTLYLVLSERSSEVIELKHAPLTLEFQASLNVECPKNVFTSQKWQCRQYIHFLGKKMLQYLDMRHFRYRRNCNCFSLKAVKRNNTEEIQ